MIQFVSVLGWVALAQALGGFSPAPFWAMGKSKRESGKDPKKTKKEDIIIIVRWFLLLRAHHPC